MIERQAQPSVLEQQLLRFALAHDGEFRVPASNLREAIITGESNVPGKGPLTKGCAILEILLLKERLTGSSSPEEAGLARQICAEKLELALAALNRVGPSFEERFNRAGVIDRQAGEVRVTISGEIVSRRPETLIDIASHAARAALSEFGDSPEGKYKLDACTGCGQRQNERSSLVGPCNESDATERISSAIKDIQDKVLSLSGLEANVRVVWENK